MGPDEVPTGLREGLDSTVGTPVLEDDGATVGSVGPGDGIGGRISSSLVGCKVVIIDGNNVGERLGVTMHGPQYPKPERKGSVSLFFYFDIYNCSVVASYLTEPATGRSLPVGRPPTGCY